ncbi:hypothetical protein AB1Y20_000025 [Prymnesium parvum]|uniref:Alpha-(1,6)-fucosyltransferase N- and catalytic domain-containing protein n=1 Tax=Prymnesium parvum TaxID=97485 RepID=A0AB34K6Y6_PRYPA
MVDLSSAASSRPPLHCLPPPRGNVTFVAFDATGAPVLVSAGRADYVLTHSASASPPAAAQHRLAPLAAMAADARSLQHALRRAASPAAGRRAAALQAVPEYGVAATVHSLVLPALSALARNETLFAPRLRLWANPARCAAADSSCFFASLPSVAAAASATESVAGVAPQVWRRLAELWHGPASAFGAAAAPAAGGRPTLESLAAAMRPRLHASRHRTAALCRRLALAQCPRLLPFHFAAAVDEAAVFRSLPHRWLRHGRFWLISQVLRFVTAPSALVERRLRRARAAVRLEAHRPVLALHVRKGDACTHRGECRGLAPFMPHVERMVETRGYRSVFLATPSPEVIAETRRFPNITWLYRNLTPSLHDAMRAHRLVRIEDALLQGGLIDPVQEWQDALIDIYLMAESDGFVGAFSSSAARLAYSLMSAMRGGCTMPFVSLDMNWCFAYMRGGPNVVRRGRSHTALGARFANLTC